MKVFYVHNTPLAGLVALGQTGVFGGAAEKIHVDRLPFLKRRQHFMWAGKDADGREVYAVWMRLDGVILTRLIESFCELHHISREQYAVHQVPNPPDFRLRLVVLAYQLGLFGVARWLLQRTRGPGKTRVPRLAGVD